MSAIANIVLADGKSTPADHTFHPIKSGETAEYREAAAGLPLAGQGTLQLALRPLGKVGSKVVFLIELPALETATGANAAGYTAAPKVGYSNKARVEFFLPDRGTEAQRKDLRVMLGNALLSETAVIEAVDTLVPAY